MRLFKYILYLANLPIYILSLRFPRNKNIWIFGSWMGNNFSDNSKYLFEYIHFKKSGIRAIWLTKNKQVLNQLLRKGYEAYLSYSFKGYWYSLRAGKGFYSVSKYDLNIYTTGSIRLVNLWHGTPLKKILRDDKVTFNPTNKYLGIIFPFLLKKPDLLIATSEIVKNNMATAFDLDENKIKITGYPRNDVFFKTHSENNTVNNILNSDLYKNHKIGIYMPTHRGEGSREITDYFKNHLRELDNFLKSNRILLLFKLHFYDLQMLSGGKIDTENILFVKNEDINDDIYSIINQTDFLVTDYSSIFFDYLLTNKPVIFFPFDYDQYLKKDRTLYYDYKAIVPGKIAWTFNELTIAILKAVNNPQGNREERQLISKKFNFFRDGSSSERVFLEVKAISG